MLTNNPALFFTQNSSSQISLPRCFLRVTLLLIFTCSWFFQTNLIAQCDPDSTPPTLVCNAGVYIGLGDNLPVTIELENLVETVSDNCNDSTELSIVYAINGGAPTSNLMLDCSSVGEHILTLEATDLSGNSSTCDIELVVEDKIPPFVSCVAPFTLNVETVPYTITPGDFINLMVDNCGVTQTLINVNGGPAAEEILLDCPELGPVEIGILAFDAAGNSNTCGTTVVLEPSPEACQSINVNGVVFADNGNCELDGNEIALNGFAVQVTHVESGVSQTVYTNENGIYAALFYIGGDSSFEVSLPEVPSSLLTCGNPITASVMPGLEEVLIDYPVALETDCPLLSIDGGTNVLRSCFSSVFHFDYCNLSTLAAENAYVEITVDSFLEITTASLPLVSVTDNTYTFEIGDLPAATCGSFTAEVFVKCDAPLELTQCLEAHIFPDDICDIPDLWSGASIEVSSACEADQVRFTIRNVGDGNMPQPLQYLIVEDVVMYMQEPFQLDAGDFLEVDVPANGATWRLEAQQEPAHPGNYEPVAWVEGCGGFNTPGLVNAFPVNNTDEFVSVFCLEVSGAYDPNDKQGFPRGWGEEQNIKPNQDLEYLIRFQNTGNDTAFNVVIVDTLDALLNPQSVRMGASSHPCHLEQAGDGILRFVFEDIMLPDSNVNLAASQGFVKFRVAQQSDLLPGTVINNEAAIYFDFNDPIITNVTKHTIEPEEGLATSVEIVGTQTFFRVFPNPFSSQTTFELRGQAVTEGELLLYNQTGQLLKVQAFSSARFQLKKQNLPAGMYWYRIVTKNGGETNGKLIIQK